MRHSPLAAFLSALFLGHAGPVEAAGPYCGPQDIQAFLEKSCERFSYFANPLERLRCNNVTDTLIHASGEFLDPLIGTCCSTHDQCYATGGTGGCKDDCDRSFERCVSDIVRSQEIFNHPMFLPTALAIQSYVPWLADRVGGDILGAFHWTDDATCGKGSFQDPGEALIIAGQPVGVAFGAFSGKNELPGRSLIAADFDGDGRTDLAFWWKATGVNRLFFARSLGPFSATSPIALTAINDGDQWIAGDFNGDGASDLLFWWKVSGTNRLFLSDRRGGFMASPATPIGEQAINGGDTWAVGDFNGDGATDLIFLWRQDGIARVFFGNTDGRFLSAGSAAIPQTAINGTDRWMTGDFNGDGVTDLYFWWRAEGTNRLFLGTQTGEFLPVDLPIGPAAINGGDQWMPGDFNGDGRIDLFFWWRESGANRVFLADAAGRFSAMTDTGIPELAINGGDTWTAGDYNRDGKSDMAFWWKESGVTRVFLGGGSGFIPMSVGLIAPTAINGGDQWISGDFDGDGARDVLFWWPSDGVNRLFLGDGQAGFRAVTEAVVPPTAINAM